MANMIFNLDLNKNNAINPIIFGRLTDGNLRKITVNITSESEPVDLTDWVIRFEGVTGGHAKVFDIMGVNILDAENGKFEYTFSKTAFSASGAYKSAYFAIEKDNMRETTNDIKIVVENVADLNAKDAETVVTELNKTIALINERYAELNSRVDVYEGDIAELESWLDERKAEIENIIDLANSNFNEKLTEIQAKLDETNQAIEKGNETIAYAYSEDGTDGFTTVYPNLNLLKNTRTLSSTSTTTAWSVLFNSSQIYDSGIKSKSGVSAMKFSFNVYVPLNAIVGGVIPIQLKGQTSQATNIGTDDYNTIISNTNYAIKQIDLGTTIRVSIPIQKSSMYQSFDNALADTASITIRQSSNISGFVYSTIKLELGSTATPWMPSASEATTNDYPRYVGYSNTVKTNKVASDYKWFPTITSHTNDKSNPHAVTAEQVNAYTKTVTFTKTEIQDLLSDAIAQAKLDANPVGSILTTISDTNPSSYIGGTWIRFANGRTLVGVDESDSVTLMQTANNTGGSVNPLTKHSHNIRRANGTQQSAIGATISWSDLPNNGGVIQEAGDNTNHNNWQPFMTVYFWRRTA